jgi:DNA-binding transcriptional LysR family regulator
VQGRFDADDGDLLTDWALAGQGIVLQPLWKVAEPLKADRLVPVLLDFPPEPVSLSVLYPHRRLLPARVKTFSDFAVTRFAEKIGKALAGMTLNELRGARVQAKVGKKKRR